MTDLTTEKLDEIRKLAKAATPGPWFAQDVPGSYSYVAHHVVVDGETLRGEPDTEEDIAYIAAADPQTVLALVEEVERLRERVRVLEMVREAAALVAERKKAMMVAAEQRLSGVHGQSMAATAAYNLAEVVYRDARLALRDSENVMREALAAAERQQET